MKRREFLRTVTGGSLTMSLPLQAARSANPSILELTFVRMRNTQDSMVQRTNDFLGKSYVPALQRAGAKQIGAFSNVIGESNPRTVLVVEYPDAATWGDSSRKLAADKDLQKAGDSFYAGPLQYVRKDVVVLRGFPSMPSVEVPRPRSDNNTHVFELRTYESNHQRSLARKIRMFDDGEIAVFRKVGMLPVFFGEALAGANLPQLTYMLAFDDLTARDKAWSAFQSHPDWNKMKNEPGASDAEIVSNISNAILRPLPFSSIR